MPGQNECLNIPRYFSLVLNSQEAEKEEEVVKEFEFKTRGKNCVLGRHFEKGKK